MFDFLKKPYPAHQPNRQNLYIALVAGVFVGFFLLIFQPFGLDDLRSPYKPILILGYGVITFCVVLFFNNTLPRIFPILEDDKTWTVGREIIYLNTLILGIAAVNTLYTPFLSPDNHLTIKVFLSMLGDTFLLGIVPSAFFVMMDYNRLLKRHVAESKALHLKESVPLVLTESKVLKIPTENEEISIHPEYLLYVESLGNYANVVIHDGEKMQKDLHRSTLKNLEQNIPLPHILRCHRSYLVNLQQVQSVSGNAQGFKLRLKNCEEIIPVSRKYVPLVKAYFA